MNQSLPGKGEKFSYRSIGCAIGKAKNNKRQVIWLDQTSCHTGNEQILQFPENQLFDCTVTCFYKGVGFDVDSTVEITDIVPTKIDIRRKKKVEIMEQYLVFAGEGSEIAGGWKNYSGSYDNLQVAQNKAQEIVEKNGKGKTWAQVVDSKTQQLINEYGYDELLEFFINEFTTKE